MLIYEKHIVLETGIEVRFHTKLDHHGVVMAVDVGIDAIEPFEQLSY